MEPSHSTFIPLRFAEPLFCVCTYVAVFPCRPLPHSAHLTLYYITPQHTRYLRIIALPPRVRMDPMCACVLLGMEPRLLAVSASNAGEQLRTPSVRPDNSWPNRTNGPLTTHSVTYSAPCDCECVLLATDISQVLTQ
ncbi:hypothetical protein B0T26DRAFT_393138 [Lasiosphaeria miniovina]|uniref:Uncharacterized protein n=1 Tax=Lasiosphaeria miniovina TaxID=1954250 RepID=A0AA40DPW1_9PEZI|nr:uncharacterized protein B0T26DRAFT_393138 [Lasiosphaeria miniovina]KAK0709071.1 hypothetical protein B0T26DRAFT_393138 [Lasiosphaeria miniovina]